MGLDNQEGVDQRLQRIEIEKENKTIEGLVEIHLELITELKNKKIDRLTANSIANQTSKILNAVRLQKDITEMKAKIPDSMKKFANINE